MYLAQGPQRSDADEARTRGLSVSSQALYHWATARLEPAASRSRFKYSTTEPLRSLTYFIKLSSLTNGIWPYSQCLPAGQGVPLKEFSFILLRTKYIQSVYEVLTELKHNLVFKSR